MKTRLAHILIGLLALCGALVVPRPAEAAVSVIGTPCKGTYGGTGLNIDVTGCVIDGSATAVYIFAGYDFNALSTVTECRLDPAGTNQLATHKTTSGGGDADGSSGGKRISTWRRASPTTGTITVRCSVDDATSLRMSIIVVAVTGSNGESTNVTAATAASGAPTAMATGGTGGDLLLAASFTEDDPTADNTPIDEQVVNGATPRYLNVQSRASSGNLTWTASPALDEWVTTWFNVIAAAPSGTNKNLTTLGVGEPHD